MAELRFFTGTMDSGKSTLALQTNHNHAARGRLGRIFTSHDRAGAATVSSRLGLRHAALEVGPGFDFWLHLVDALCWCGRRATHNARTHSGVMVTEGDVVVVGDVPESAGAPPAEVGHEVLCRQNHRRGMTASRARAVSMVGDPLPFA